MDVNYTHRSFQEEVRARIDSWGGKIREIEDKAKWISDESSKKRFLGEIAELKSKRDQLSSKLNEMDRLPKSSLEAMRSNVETIARDFRNNLNTALAKFK